MKLNTTFSGNLLAADGTGGGSGEGTPDPNAAAAVSVEERNRAIEKARKEEKDKLYPQIEKLQGDNKTLAEQNAQLGQEINALKSKVEAFGKATNGGNKWTLRS